jgi:hypothetical protein
MTNGRLIPQPCALPSRKCSAAFQVVVADRRRAIKNPQIALRVFLE